MAYPFYNGLPPHQAHSATSKAAAVKAISRAGNDRARILQFIQSRGWLGATSDEAQRHFGLAHQTGSARVAELLQSGAIIRTGRTRKTIRGCEADVLVAAPPGTPSVSTMTPRNFGREFFKLNLLKLKQQLDAAVAHDPTLDQLVELAELLKKLQPVPAAAPPRAPTLRLQLRDATQREQ